MSTGGSAKPSFSELIALRYDLVTDLYRQRARALEVQANSDSVEYWAYKVLGSDLMASIALTFDPYWQFAKLDRKPTDNKLIDGLYPLDPVPVNRTSIFPCVWPMPLKYHYKRWNRHEANNMVWSGSYWYLGPMVVTTTTIVEDTYVLGTQALINGFRKDTTWKSRNPGKKIPKTRQKQDKLGLNRQGEFELYVPTLTAYAGGDYYRYSSDSTFQTQAITDAHGNPFVTTIFDKEFRGGEYLSACASVTPAAVSSYAVAEKTNATNVMVKNLDHLLGKCLPGRRYFNLAYQIGELKDLPQLIRGTLSAWRDIETLVGKEEFKKALTNPQWWSQSKIRRLAPYLERVGVKIEIDKSISSAYLTFKFGWQSMYQAVVGLVNKPKEAAKDTNLVIDRNGKFTTLSSGFNYEESVTSTVPNITMYQPVYWNTDPSLPVSQTATRKVKLRCVVNSGVNFPTVDLPRLRQKVFLEKLGVIPTPGDLYDLVPFTWLVDWFAGLGEYIHLMENINSDRALINWGFMTYSSVLQVRSSLHLYADTTTSYDFIPPNVWTVTNQKERYNPSALFEAKYILRKSLKSLASVKTYSGGNLSSYQYSILTALFSHFR
jgi:hypothetical protein